MPAIYPTAELGRYFRGEQVLAHVQLEVAPDAAPTCRVYRSDGTLILTTSLPQRDRRRLRFGATIFLDATFTDETYWYVVTWAESAVTQHALGCFQVRGGTGLPQTIALIEQPRPLGLAVIQANDQGEIGIGYNPTRAS